MAHDRGSQILVLPATSTRLGAAQSRHIVQTIIADDSAGNADPYAPSNEEDLVPWHIANRYYEAKVCFRISKNALIQQAQPSGRSSDWVGRTRRAQSQDTATQPDAADLDTQVRDVFAALELGPAPSQAAHVNNRNTTATIANGHIRALMDDVAGVQAVVIIVDRDQPLSQHRKILSVIETPTGEGGSEDASVLLSGFDLAISLIIALPSPLQDASAPIGLASVPGTDDVEALYSGAGWEYIDLAKGLDGHLEDDSGDDDVEGSLAGEEEKQGFERIREALMTHTWPGLTRKHDRRSRPDTRVDSNEDEGLDLQHTLSALRSQLDAIDNVGTTEPTERDEELARAFLARIQAAQSAGLGGDGDTDVPLLLATNEHTTAPRSTADMQANLERFLQSEDGQWPSSGGANGRSQPLTNSNEDAAWDLASRNANEPGASDGAFDDDFTDFVHAGLSVTNGHHDDASVPLDDDELAFLGDEDDAVLLRALAASRGSASGSSDVQIHFESTLSAVMAQAERVRAIADYEQRREEAARVALALLDQ